MYGERNCLIQSCILLYVTSILLPSVTAFVITYVSNLEEEPNLYTVSDLRIMRVVVQNLSLRPRGEGGFALATAVRTSFSTASKPLAGSFPGSWNQKQGSLAYEEFPIEREPKVHPVPIRDLPHAQPHPVRRFDRPVFDATGFPAPSQDHSTGTQWFDTIAAGLFK
jgi:hypothetical protein